MNRGDVDDASAARLPHRRQGGAADPERPAEIDVERQVPFGVGDVLGPLVSGARRGTVDQTVELPLRRDSIGYRVPDLGIVPDIDLPETEREPLPGKRFGKPHSIRAVQPDADHTGTERRQQLRCRPADTGCGTRDQDDLSRHRESVRCRDPDHAALPARRAIDFCACAAAIIRSTLSSLASARDSSPTTLPSAMTSERSARPITSSSSEETTISPTPVSARSTISR